jgi:uncharacterized membrane protein YciS (DUF1049 family)
MLYLCCYMSTLATLQAEREGLIAKLSVSLLQVFGILFIPVVAAVFVGKGIDARYNTGSLLTFALAASVMAISWIFIWKIYKRIDNKMIELDREIKEEKDKLKDIQDTTNKQ